MMDIEKLKYVSEEYAELIVLARQKGYGMRDDSDFVDSVIEIVEERLKQLVKE
jgi:hypothetical protein